MRENLEAGGGVSLAVLVQGLIQKTDKIEKPMDLSSKNERQLFEMSALAILGSNGTEVLNR